MGVCDEPFVGSWALAARALTRRQLQRDFERIHHDVYVARGRRLDAVDRAKAAGYWAHGNGILVGHSAAALHGSLWIDQDLPAEIALATGRRAPAGIVAVRDTIAAEERCERLGFAVSTPARTAFDLGRRLPRERAVVALDDLFRATSLHPDSVLAVAESHPGARGIRSLRSALALVDAGAQSPPETMTRLLMIDDGLPPPVTQIPVRYSAHGTLYIDLGWPDRKVGVEYDGRHHWTDPFQRARDIDRLAVLSDLGWIIVRAGADLLYRRPHILLERTRAALRARGAHLD
ncbi:hypothetical protein [Nocardia stercoris]|uniref:DUF559 domain-containing protein n=1 Tax=Nocardia stercoris TaxID=2483361 RepID=A0A3M2KZV3_9NOCA|nr:hypothetical protein [Nocardia stercoris]RMI29793.1 hypothetical protein EBN03_23590 [Nocardia stercoris]